ncbi:type II toxin-antitoxin system RelB/DinJ family antitoxin [Desulfoscipio gibsoniae]|uniref:Addiction module antitoxin, RelB/DinJ family n=1 Tax=Desulfoscipio gibsoniae DSM 7213 TaxID=767817 RepID=R4KGD9_9FIRM|nr:type II toxin-antitoxin system RelB/DinJ family antitoxin [Desulfoscipio gibsoniae]AGL00732.1 addiction module antitoxin, RelB/DinJ family [Desulfoscipio gibsoniae DSM 7213]
MANDTTNLNIRMDVELKKQAEELFSELGMNMTTAINIFLRQAVRQGSIPFAIKLNDPNAETVAAMKEGEDIIKSGKSRFYNTEEMFKDLGI